MIELHAINFLDPSLWWRNTNIHIFDACEQDLGFLLYWALSGHYHNSCLFHWLFCEYISHFPGWNGRYSFVPTLNIEYRRESLAWNRLENIGLDPQCSAVGMSYIRICPISNNVDIGLECQPCIYVTLYIVLNLLSACPTFLLFYETLFRKIPADEKKTAKIYFHYLLSLPNILSSTSFFNFSSMSCYIVGGPAITVWSLILTKSFRLQGFFSYFV